MSRFVVSLGPNEVLGAEGDPAVALSPDGSHLVYVAGKGDQNLLYLRSLDQLQATPISGSEGATTAFFSPDGRWVGFYADNKVKKLPLDGGVPIALCDAPLPVGASWGSDGTIVFTPGDFSGLFRVSANGGTPQVVTTPDPGKGESSHRWPDVLPGGKAILFTIWTDGTLDNAEIAVVSPEAAEQRVLVEGGSFARYVPTGHLVYARQGALLAVPFNLASLEVTGTPIPVLDGVFTDPRWGTASFGVSNDGSLVYVPSGLPERRLVWVDREGKVQPLTESRRSFSQPRLSPDGKRVAVTVEGLNPDVWVYEIARDTLTRLTFDRTPDSDPIWAPDGKRITFRSQSLAGWSLLSKFADGSGGEETLITGPNNQFPSSWSPDGTVLAFMEFNPTTNWDLRLLPLEDERNSRPFVQSQFGEFWSAFSPDGRWLAYMSTESGRSEVYVQRYLGAGEKWQISTEGGGWPRWAPNSRELFYLQDDKMMAVPISIEPEFSAGKPKVLFEGRFLTGYGSYDVAPDGQKFLMVQEEREPGSQKIHVVLNWFEELKRLVPTEN